MAWCAGGCSIWRNGSSRNSASQSPSRRSAGSCEPWATANYRPDRVTMRKPRARSRILKKLPRAPGGNCAQEGACPRHDRNLVRRRSPHRPEEQDHPPLGQARHPSKRTAGPTHRFHLHLRCSLPEGGQGCSPDHAGLQHRGDELAPRRDRRNRRARCPRHPPGRSSRLALVHAPPRAGQYHHHSAAAEVPRAQPGRERLAVHARQLALQPHLQILRRSRRPLLRGMEQARRSALAHHVHRTAPMGPRVLINGIWYQMVASPWLDIPLADYEGHMALPEIAQARMLADELESAVRQHAPSSVAIIGCSGGNGFERLIGTTVERIVGIDINPTYVAAAQARFGTQLPKLALYAADIQDALPNIRPMEMIFAGLIFEYVDLRAAMHNLRRLCAPGGTLVAVLQAPSAEAKAVSPSPYRSLQRLAPAMRLRDAGEVKGVAAEAGFAPATTRSLALPSGKSFIVLSFHR